MLLIADIDLIATLDDAGTVTRGGHILCEGNRIAAVGTGAFEGHADRVIDGAGHIAIPGLVNTHHHMTQCLTRNTPRAQCSMLFDWLVTHYDVWRELDVHATYIATKVAMGELLTSGCTTTTDHFYLFPEQAGPGLIDAQIRAARELGIRFHPCRGSMSRGRSAGGLPPDDTVQTPREILDDSERLLSEYHDASPGSMLRIALAPCSPFSVDESLMRDTLALARSAGVQVHTHLAETIDENEYCLREYGCRPLELLERMEWLGPDVWLAHGVHFDDDEIAMLGRTRTGIAHCPVSNLRLGSGIARVPELIAAGANVGLGVDGSASNDCGNLMAEARQALLIHRLRPTHEWLDHDQVLRLATRGGAALLGRDDIGQLAPGKAADIVLIDRYQLSLAGTSSDPLAGLLYSPPAAPADMVIVDGRVVVESGKIPGLDVGALVGETNALGDAMFRRAAARTGIDYTRPPGKA